MTNEKKIKILSNQLDKLHATEDFLAIFYISHWQTETLEYLRVFFGADSELYKKCKQYNDAADEEHKNKTYTVGSAMWLLHYTDMLFSAIGVLQHDMHKKSKFAVSLKGFTLAGVIAIIIGAGTLTYYVGKWEGISLGKSLISPENDTTHKQPQQVPKNKTANQPEKNHTDSIR